MPRVVIACSASDVQRIVNIEDKHDTRTGIGSTGVEVSKLVLSVAGHMECFFPALPPALPWLSDENQLRVPLLQAISLDARCGFVNTHPQFEWFQH